MLLIRSEREKQNINLQRTVIRVSDKLDQISTHRKMHGELNAHYHFDAAISLEGSSKVE
jgi:hypothetical protein